MSRVPTVRFQVLHKGGIHVAVDVYVDGNGVGCLEITDDVFAALWDTFEASELVNLEVAILRPVKGHRGTWCWCDADVEVDETYVGGKPRKGSKIEAKRGRGTRKQPVMAMVERNGRAKTRVVSDVSGRTLKKAIREGVDRSARILTDEWGGYYGVGKDFDGGHETVTHSEREYARGDVHTNTAESFFALLKRGIVGAFHHVSKKHLWRYADEFEFRWNHRRVNDHDRTMAALAQSGGKTLTYRRAVTGA